MADCNYIIDFDRINELCSHKDDCMDSAKYLGSFAFSITKKVLKDFIDIYLMYQKDGSLIHTEKYKYVVKTLIYNRVLINIRDKTINDLLS